MLRRTVAAAQPIRTTAYLKLFEVYLMQYDSPAPAGTSVLSAGQTPCRVRRLYLSLGFLADVIFTQTTHTTPRYKTS